MAHAHKHFGAEKVVKAEVATANADMNVTPLIDVLLVLLVIFMATLPLGQKGVDINLPPESNEQQPNQPPPINQIVLEYTADRHLSVNKQDVTVAGLEKMLRDIFETRKEKKMFISGAETLRYGDIMEVIDAARGAGVEQLGIVTKGMRNGAAVGGN